MTRCADRRAAVVADVKLPGAVSLFMGKVRELARGGSLVCHVVFEGDCRIGEVRAEMRNPYLRLSPTQLQHGYLVVSPPVTDAPETSENNTNTYTGLSDILSFQNELQQLKGETTIPYAAEQTKTHGRGQSSQWQRSG